MLMMTKKKFNPLALLGLLGFLGLVGIVKGDALWYSWFGWFVWFRYMFHPIDERFKLNFDRAGRNGFLIALLGVSAIIVMKGMKVAEQMINGTIAGLFIVMVFSFVLSFYYFEKLGE